MGLLVGAFAIDEVLKAAVCTDEGVWTVALIGLGGSQDAGAALGRVPPGRTGGAPVKWGVMQHSSINGSYSPTQPMQGFPFRSSNSGWN